MLKNKKIIKVLSIIVFVAMVLMMVGNTVMAYDAPTPSDSVTLSSEVNTTVGQVLGIIKIGGIIIAVVIAMFIGIKYITASPEGKAEVKKTIMYYVGGIVILLSASAIVNAIQSALGK